MTTTDGPATRATLARRWLAGPPRWTFGAALLLTVAVSVYAVSAPGALFDLVLVALGGWMLLIGVFGVRLVVSAAIAAERRRIRSMLPLWLVFPVVLVASFMVTSSALPARLGLAAAKGDMLAYARDKAADEPDRVGPYKVLSAVRLPGDGARFTLKGTGFLDTTGWAYSPGGAPRSVPDDVTYTRISGDWYEFVQTTF